MLNDSRSCGPPDSTEARRQQRASRGLTRWSRGEDVDPVLNDNRSIGPPRRSFKASKAMAK